MGVIQSECSSKGRGIWWAHVGGGVDKQRTAIWHWRQKNGVGKENTDQEKDKTIFAVSRREISELECIGSKTIDNLLKLKQTMV